MHKEWHGASASGRMGYNEDVWEQGVDDGAPAVGQRQIQAHYLSAESGEPHTW